MYTVQIYVQRGFYWPISLGISAIELRDKSKTMRLSKVEMNRGIFWSPIRCNCHSWMWASWTRAAGRVCRQMPAVRFTQSRKPNTSSYLPFFSLDPKNHTSFFSHNFFLQLGQSYAVFPGTRQPTLNIWFMVFEDHVFHGWKYCTLS